MPIPNRRPSVTEDVGVFKVTVSYDPRTGQACEMFMTARGKSGTDIDELLYQLGVKVSKMMQGEVT